MTNRTHRVVVIHYHLFKNAGTSVDEMLRDNFGTGWAQQEFKWGGPGASNAEEVAQFLETNPWVTALSSHTARLPVPRIAGTSVFPILFLRDPIDRLRSAYIFERSQQADTLGAQLAKEFEFRGYLRALLAEKYRRQARNFQTHCLSSNEPGPRRLELERALRALASLPFIGVVEAYDQSIKVLEGLLRPLVPSFRAVSVRRNSTPARPARLSERLDEVEQELGSSFYGKLRRANMDDIELHELAAKRFAFYR